MKNTQFKKYILCSVVATMLLGSTVTYGQSFFIGNKSIRLVEDESRGQLVVKPGYNKITLEVGDLLSHDVIREHVMFDDGSVLPEGYEFEPVFLAGGKLFNNQKAIAPGKASIRIKVKGTSHDYSAITHTCIDVEVIAPTVEPPIDPPVVEPPVVEPPVVVPPTEPEETTVSHMPYIYGYEDGTFRADSGVSREEIASMVSRLILNGTMPIFPNHYEDLSDARYSARHAAHLTQLGIMSGYGDQLFLPHQSITRREMAAVITNTVAVTGASAFRTVTTPLGDVASSDWALPSIQFVVAQGFMDGEIVNGKIAFRPDDVLTRAEAVITLNRVFKRECSDATIHNPYSDLKPSHWAYGEILYASVLHSHQVEK